MEIVGKVTQADVPLTGKKSSGIWTNLARQMIETHMQGQVLVVRVADNEERKRMVNGTAEVIRHAGLSRSFTTVNDPDGGMRVYCQLIDREPASVVVKPLKRPRRRANG